MWVAALIVALTFSSDAQVLQTIYSFTNPNGASPLGALTRGADGNFYGVTSAGGSNLHGTIFSPR